LFHESSTKEFTAKSKDILDEYNNFISTFDKDSYLKNMDKIFINDIANWEFENIDVQQIKDI